MIEIRKVELSDMLSCRETRAAKQRKPIEQYKRPVVSLSMNIAGDVKNTPAISMLQKDGEAEYKAAAEKFKTISGFKDADSLVGQCLDKAEEWRKDAIYASAHNEQIKGTIDGCNGAIRLFESISGWKDTDEQIYACQRKIEEIKAKEEADAGNA
jgi:hypothetical protein